MRAVSGLVRTQWLHMELDVRTLHVGGVPIFLVIGFWVVGASLVIDFTLANIGSIMQPEMAKNGYDERFAAA